MSEDIENTEGQMGFQDDNDENGANSVPIISDKEIEAIFVGGVPAEADESNI